MPHIKAQDEIVIKATVKDVWKVLVDFQHYQDWWPKYVNLKILKLSEAIVGTKFKANPLGGKSFACRVISIIPNQEIKLEYIDGIYRGSGYWNLESKEGLVNVSYIVDLEIVNKSIALLSKLISISKIQSLIFKNILKGLDKQITIKHISRQ